MLNFSLISLLRLTLDSILRTFLANWLVLQQQLNLNETQYAGVCALCRTFTPPVPLERLFAESVSQLNSVLKEVIEQQVKKKYGNKDLKDFYTGDIALSMNAYNKILGVLLDKPKDTTYKPADAFQGSI